MTSGGNREQRWREAPRQPSVLVPSWRLPGTGRAGELGGLGWEGDCQDPGPCAAVLHSLAACRKWLVLVQWLGFPRLGEAFIGEGRDPDRTRGAVQVSISGPRNLAFSWGQALHNPVPLHAIEERRSCCEGPSETGPAEGNKKRFSSSA